MIIDTHVHSAEYSPCSQVRLEEAIIRAKEIGLDGICVTDHGSSSIQDKAGELSRKHEFLVLVGMELLTFEGDLLVFGLQEVPANRMHADLLINLVQKNKGIAISAHPFRDKERSLGELIKKVAGVSGVEAFNSTTEPYYNYMAYTLGMSLGLPCLGGSDAHAIEMVGQCATIFPGSIRDVKDLIAAVKAGDVSPALYDTAKKTFEPVTWPEA